MVFSITINCSQISTMNLTIDFGNTFIKIVVFEDTIPVYRNQSKSISSNHINRILRNFPIRHAMISSVVNLKKPLMNMLKKIPHFEKLSISTIIPVKNKYETPATLGNDRLANAIAGSFLFPGRNVLIIDTGTCVKYDFINSRKEYIGGSISPGLDMRFRAMHHYTGKLPLIKFENEIKLTGTSTVMAMQSGVMVGIIEEMNGFISRYKKKYKSLKVILTGGDAFRFAGELKLSIFAAEDLVNIGLNEIIRFNSPKTK